MWGMIRFPIRSLLAAVLSYAGAREMLLHPLGYLLRSLGDLRRSYQTSEV